MRISYGKGRKGMTKRIRRHILESKVAHKAAHDDSPTLRELAQEAKAYIAEKVRRAREKGEEVPREATIRAMVEARMSIEIARLEQEKLA